MPEPSNTINNEIGDNNELRGNVSIGNIGAITQEYHEHRHYEVRRSWLPFGRNKTPESYDFTPDVRMALIKTMQNILASANRGHEQRVYLEMGLREVPALVSPAWREHIRGDTHERNVLEREIPSIFERTSKLVILGAPGAGKTNQLQRLCVYLLLEAEQNPKLPVPIIVNLSGFSSSPASFEQWLFGAMTEVLGHSVVFWEILYRNRHISLLFDGLDEVSTERRSTCIEALNALVPQVDQMVVCSRLVEYQAMQPLTFDNALVLQPI
ncbi:MAG: NACHT domain-containing protein [Herpetosiphon sp.]|nr:NACHT domain-containing protein [Herpetosiphon sp.]